MRAGGGRRGVFDAARELPLRVFFEDNNTQNGGMLRQGGYALANLRPGYRAPGGRWEVVANANNLLGKNYLVDAGNVGGAFGIPTSIRAAPRMVGVKATVRF